MRYHRTKRGKNYSALGAAIMCIFMHMCFQIIDIGMGVPGYICDCLRGRNKPHNPEGHIPGPLKQVTFKAFCSLIFMGTIGLNMLIYHVRRNDNTKTINNTEQGYNSYALEATLLCIFMHTCSQLIDIVLGRPGQLCDCLGVIYNQINPEGHKAGTQKHIDLKGNCLLTVSGAIGLGMLICQVSRMSNISSATTTNQENNSTLVNCC